MSSSITRGGDLPDSSQKTDFYALVDNATLNNVVSTDTAQTVSGQKTLSNPLLFSGSGIPKHTIVLTASGAVLPSSNYPARTANTGTNFAYYTLDFDNTTNETAYWTFIVPDRITGLTCSVYVYWLSSGTADYTTEFEIQSLGRTNDEALDASMGAAVAIDDAIEDSNDLMVSPAGTLTHGWSGGDLAVIKVTVDADGGGGTKIDADTKILAIKIEWSASTNTD